MALSSLEDNTHQPSPDDLATALGRTARLWGRLVDEVVSRHAPIEQVWNFGGPKYGWSLRIRRKGRNVLYLIPQKRQFLVGIVLGDRAVKAARQSDLAAEVLAMIDAAPVYAEGCGIRVPVTTRAHVEAMLKLTAIKLAGPS